MADAADLTGVDGELLPVMLVPVAAFVLTGLTTTLLWDEPLDVALLIWQAVILWPIGWVLLVGPSFLVGSIRRPALRWIGVTVVTGSGVGAMVAVAASDDAQAGLGFLYAAVVGYLGAGVVCWPTGQRAGNRGSMTRAARAIGRVIRTARCADGPATARHR